jgi:hypothetical protein
MHDLKTIIRMNEEALRDIPSKPTKDYRDEIILDLKIRLECLAEENEALKSDLKRTKEIVLLLANITKGMAENLPNEYFE